MRIVISFLGNLSGTLRSRGKIYPFAHAFAATHAMDKHVDADNVDANQVQKLGTHARRRSRHNFLQVAAFQDGVDVGALKDGIDVHP